MNRIFLTFILSIPIACFPIAPLNFQLYSSATDNGQVAYLFAHGCFASQNQGLSYAKSYTKGGGKLIANENWIIQEPFATFNFHDANSWDFSWTDLGQAHDMKRLHRAYSMLRSLLPNHKIILVGLSRGAVTCIHYITTYHPENLCALILESPFDSINTLLSSIVKNYISWVPYAKPALEAVFRRTFSSLPKNPMITTHKIILFPASLPVLFVCSSQDKLVPSYSVELLKNIVEASDHPNVHLMKLTQGKHGKLLRGSSASDYYKSVHSFYKNYGLPYDFNAL